MTERPILFSAEMVRAILQARKTQTRRVMKGVGLRMLEDGFTPSYVSDLGNAAWCPYGTAGDHLWVREAFQPIFAEGCKFRDVDWDTGKGYAIRYVATDGRTEWMDADDGITDRCKPGIHMPRWASRITLEVTGVRVERVQEISEEDALAEGIALDSIAEKDWTGTEKSEGCHRGRFAVLWDKINGKRGCGWETNPWVWAIEFKVGNPDHPGGTR